MPVSLFCIIECLLIISLLKRSVSCELGNEDKEEPSGHLQPLGSHGSPVGDVDELNRVPHPQYFFDNYVKWNNPVIFKGAGRDLPAFTSWSDDQLRYKYGEMEVEVEIGKKENRSSGLFTMKLDKFVDVYESENLYLVESVKSSMKGDVGILRCLLCGGFTKLIQDAVLWFSSGATTSVLHYDNVDNINCVVDGQKEIFLVDKRIADKYIVFDRSESGYSTVDVDKVDMFKYPGLRDVPYYWISLEPGDCFYLPTGWPHYVRTPPGRSVAVNIWFARLIWFDALDCKGKDLPDFETLDKIPYSSSNEPLKADLLLKAENYTQISETDFWNIYSSFLGSRKQLRKVFSFLDSNEDGSISWQELYDVSADSFVMLFPWLFDPQASDDVSKVEHDEL